MPAASDSVNFHMLRFDSAGMPDDYPERIRNSSLSQHVKVVHARLNANLEVRGVPIILVGEQGRSHAKTSNMSATPEVELGPEAASNLGVGPGDDLHIESIPVRVIGIRDPPPDGMGMGVFASLGMTQTILGRPNEINAMRLA